MGRVVERTILAGLALAIVLAAAGCDDGTDPVVQPPPAEKGDYVGAAVCGECHRAVYEHHLASGHHQHFQRIDDAQPPVYVWVEAMAHPVPGPPAGLGWDDVLVVLGGTTRSTVFVGRDGNLITGAETRWDAEAGAWAAYRPGEVVPFACGECHATGYDPAAEHDGPDGLVGTWEEDGVSCEACHGPGRAHVESESADDIVVDTSNDLCVRCHSVFRDHPYPETGNVDRNLEHFGVRCVVCHDPHVSARYDRARAIKVECWDCHVAKAQPGLDGSSSGLVH